MPRNGILNLIFSILAYLFIGYLAVAFFITVFPLLAVLVAFAAVAALVLYLVSYIQMRPLRRKNVDEYGNRKTTAEILEMKDAEKPSIDSKAEKKDEM
jgi:glycopeptide antibiotics resistance protein